MRLALGMTLLMLSVGYASADPVDSVTSLPIHPAFAGEDPMPDGMVCGKKAQKALARAPAGKQKKTATRQAPGVHEIQPYGGPGYIAGHLCIRRWLV
jgi:hypothetical protein